MSAVNETRPCDHCRRLYQVSGKGQRYCGSRCRYRAKNAANQDRLDSAVRMGAARIGWESRHIGYQPAGDGVCGCGAERALYREGVIAEGAPVVSGVLMDDSKFTVASLERFCAGCVAKRAARRMVEASVGVKEAA